MISNNNSNEDLHDLKIKNKRLINIGDLDIEKNEFQNINKINKNVNPLINSLRKNDNEKIKNDKKIPIYRIEKENYNIPTYNNRYSDLIKNNSSEKNKNNKIFNPFLNLNQVKQNERINKNIDLSNNFVEKIENKNNQNILGNDFEKENMSFNFEPNKYLHNSNINSENNQENIYSLKNKEIPDFSSKHIVIPGTKRKQMFSDKINNDDDIYSSFNFDDNDELKTENKSENLNLFDVKKIKNEKKNKSSNLGFDDLLDKKIIEDLKSEDEIKKSNEKYEKEEKNINNFNIDSFNFGFDKNNKNEKDLKLDNKFKKIPISLTQFEDHKEEVKYN